MDIDTTLSAASPSRRWIRARYAAVEEVIDLALHAAARADERPERLARAIADVLHTVEAHVRFEVAEIAPRLDPNTHLGPDRLERLFARHDRVRGLMAQLRDSRPEQPDVLLQLIRGLEAEIDAAVLELVIPEITNDDPVVTDELSS